ncbi:cobalamin-5-phosphate synthase CobS [Alkalithermobacter thermoalcaliphilus JW-YL-7 = DSM 7308]|uniref:Cobalamin-5-phosphate synthase CobS n=1 Tax=Alkalithermobacter thermoalcaliphilus JW-YL-7 = DSM 7308 TaxID=1121328 RepID=A0A150FMQ0_CLOPD|nr:cobalamin-5-phosphate synthase CobS [[Clostridium] paradoxum JW-YL-7 = DSM 7308]
MGYIVIQIKRNFTIMKDSRLGTNALLAILFLILLKLAFVYSIIQKTYCIL